MDSLNPSLHGMKVDLDQVIRLGRQEAGSSFNPKPSRYVLYLGRPQLTLL